ncbi:UDP-3-O-acyl-N-acetylglucosamine deacetylase [Nymphon striatum]|nr:UDP-3-O-acyl-N-acetylglucosamine deacetylase [Nymphon striatum]
MTDFMRWGASRFVEAELSYSHGMSSPLDESVYLVLRSLNLPVDTPDVYWNSKLTDSEKQIVISNLRLRIEKRLPAAYIMKEGWFAGLQFHVDDRVLVPRSPIAELVESQFTPWVNPDEIESVLDLCTGSGCIGIACAYAFPYAKIDLSDISVDALDVARINVKKHDASDRVSVIHSDLFAELESKQYDIIVSNPPYVDADDIRGMSMEFHYEPELGLSSGDDGLDCTRQILKQAASHLTDNGILVLEVGNSQYSLAEEFPDVPFQWLEFERGGDGVFVLLHSQKHTDNQSYQYLPQRTLKSIVSTTGIGLHSGKKVNLSLRPAAVNTGIVFRRIDLETPIDIPAAPKSVQETMLSTTLVHDDGKGSVVKVSTIEHLMSALAGMGIDNVYIDISAEEVPIMDGSAAPFIFLIESAGVENQVAPKKFVKITKPIKFENQAGWATLSPYDGFKISFEIDFDHPAVRDTQQVLELDLSVQSYAKEISRARTFGFMRDVELLRSKNLGLGGSLGNAVVLDEFRVLNKDGLRYGDEFVKHKMLDAIGDLYTLGYGIIGAYHGHKSGHAINNLLLRELLIHEDSWEVITLEQEARPPVFYAGETSLI